MCPSFCNLSQRQVQTPQVDERTAQMCYGPPPGNTSRLGAVAFSFCFAAAAPLLHFRFRFSFIFFASHAQWNISVNVSKSLSASAFSFHLLYILRFRFPFFILFRMHNGTSPSTCLSTACLRLFPSSFHLPGRSKMLSPRDYSQSSLRFDV